MAALRKNIGIVLLVAALLVLAQACASVRAARERVSPNVVLARE